MSIVDASNVVHATNDEVSTIGRPCQVIDLCTARPTHMLGPPRLFVFLAFGTEVGLGGLAGNPEDNVAIVTGGGEEFTFGSPADYIDGLVMLG